MSIAIDDVDGVHREVGRVLVAGHAEIHIWANNDSDAHYAAERYGEMIAAYYRIPVHAWSRSRKVAQYEPPG